MQLVPRTAPDTCTAALAMVAVKTRVDVKQKYDRKINYSLITYEKTNHMFSVEFVFAMAQRLTTNDTSASIVTSSLQRHNVLKPIA